MLIDNFKRILESKGFECLCKDVPLVDTKTITEYRKYNDKKTVRVSIIEEPTITARATIAIESRSGRYIKTLQMDTGYIDDIHCKLSSYMDLLEEQTHFQEEQKISTEEKNERSNFIDKKKEKELEELEEFVKLFYERRRLLHRKNV